MDALRGIAALAVLLLYLDSSAVPKLPITEVARAMWWGRAGVEIFFVRSDFTVPFIMNRQAYQPITVPTFLARRVLRIRPPAVVLILATPARFLAIRYGLGNDSNEWQIGPACFFANLFPLILLTQQSWMNGVLWTLAVEFKIYLVLAPLYLVHFLVASTTEHALLRFLFEPTDPLKILGNHWYLALAIGGAAIFYVLIKRRFVSLSPNIGRRRDLAVDPGL